MPRIDPTFSYESPVAADTLHQWQQTLEAAVPRAEGYVSHLRIVWEAGDPWDVVQRWYLYDCTPRQVFEDSAARKRLLGCPEMDNGDAILIRDLDSHSPREDGYFDPLVERASEDGTTVQGEYIALRDRNCTLQQWHLWHQHGVYGLPWWVIQGNHGGHKRYFSTQEKKALNYQKLPCTPPIPGSLPYAPFDRRVLDRILMYDRLRRTEVKLSREGVRAEHQALVTKARDQYLTLLTEMAMEARDMVKHEDLPRLGMETPGTDVEQEIETFLQRA
jgi:hypothetical protein